MKIGAVRTIDDITAAPRVPTSPSRASRHQPPEWAAAHFAGGQVFAGSSAGGRVPVHVPGDGGPRFGWVESAGAPVIHPSLPDGRSVLLDLHPREERALVQAGDFVAGIVYEVDLESGAASRLLDQPGWTAVYATGDTIAVSTGKGAVHLFRHRPGAALEHLDGLEGLYWAKMEGRADGGVVWTASSGDTPAQLFRVAGDRIELLGTLGREDAGGPFTLRCIDGQPVADVNFGKSLRSVELAAATPAATERRAPWELSALWDEMRALHELSPADIGGDTAPLFDRLGRIGFAATTSTTGQPCSLLVWFSDESGSVTVLAIPDDAVSPAMRRALEAMTGRCCAPELDDVGEERWPELVRLYAAIGAPPEDADEFWQVLVEDMADMLADPEAIDRLPGAAEIASLHGGWLRHRAATTGARDVGPVPLAIPGPVTSVYSFRTVEA